MANTLIAIVVAASALACVPQTLRPQAADRYHGAVVNSSVPSSPASLDLAVFDRSDTLTVGWLTIGPPLAGTGIAVGFVRGRDSLLLVSMSQSGDTIFWTSPSRSGTIGGSYSIRSGISTGQSGSWQLRPVAAPSRLPLIGSAIASAIVLTLALLGIAHGGMERWWRWRDPRKLPLLPDQQRRSLTGVGGWLGWFVFGVILTLIYKLVTIESSVENLGTGAWLISAVVPGIRPTLFVESVFHFIQILGSVVGLALLFRSSRSAPLFWVLLLILFISYGIYDLGAGSTTLAFVSQQFGAKLGKQVGDAMSEASSLNARLVIFSIIWSLYFVRSRRVRLSFGQAVEEPIQSTAMLSAVS